MKTVQVNSLKYDGRIHRTWHAELIEVKDPLLVLKGVFAEDLVHSNLGSISKGTISYEYYWLDRWYNVFRFHEPDGRLRNYYCNVNMPPKFQNNELNYVDLDLDIIVGPDWDKEILDIQEFQRNASVYEYGDQLKSFALDQIDVLSRMIDAREFPFSESI